MLKPFALVPLLVSLLQTLSVCVFLLFLAVFFCRTLQNNRIASPTVTSALIQSKCSDCLWELLHFIINADNRVSQFQQTQLSNQGNIDFT